MYNQSELWLTSSEKHLANDRLKSDCQDIRCLWDDMGGVKKIKRSNNNWQTALIGLAKCLIIHECILTWTDFTVVIYQFYVLVFFFDLQKFETLNFELQCLRTLVNFLRTTCSKKAEQDDTGTLVGKVCDLRWCCNIQLKENGPRAKTVFKAWVYDGLAHTYSVSF